VINKDIVKTNLDGSFDDIIYGTITMVFSVTNLRNSISEVRRNIIIACLGALTIGIFITVFISRLISRPLEVLLKTFTTIAYGDLSVRVNIDSKEEFGQLARTFNRMVDSLEESYYELAETNKNMERIVSERTKEYRDQVEVRTKAEEKVKATNKMVSSIINTSPLPIVTLSVDFKVKSASPAIKQIFHYEEAEILEKVLPFVYMSDTEYVKDILKELTEASKVERNLTVKGRKKNGELVELKMAAVAEFSDDNIITGYIIIIDDITEGIVAEKALRASETKYRSLIEDSNIGIGIIKDVTFTFANKALLSI